MPVTISELTVHQQGVLDLQDSDGLFTVKICFSSDDELEDGDSCITAPNYMYTAVIGGGQMVKIKDVSGQLVYFNFR